MTMNPAFSGSLSSNTYSLKTPGNDAIIKLIREEINAFGNNTRR